MKFSNNAPLLCLLGTLLLSFSTQLVGQNETRFKLVLGNQKSLDYRYRFESPSDEQPSLDNRATAEFDLGLAVQISNPTKMESKGQQSVFTEIGFNFRSSRWTIDKFEIDTFNVIAGEIRSFYPRLYWTKNKLRYKSDTKWTYFGYGCVTDFAYSEFSSYDLTRFYNQEHWEAGIHLLLTYRLIHKPLKKLRMEYGIGIQPMGWSYGYYDIKNPILSRNQQRNGSFDFDLFTGARMFLAFSLRGKSKPVFNGRKVD